MIEASRRHAGVGGGSQLLQICEVAKLHGDLSSQLVAMKQAA